MKLTYFNIQRFCLRDGPGIRTTLFLKGCPVNCIWCHNPEGKSSKPELLFFEDRCASCGACLGLCPARSIADGKIAVDRALCTACGKCADICLNDACEICGKVADAEEIYAELIRDKLFFDTSGGGITLSGGEPLYQAEAALYLAERAAADGIPFAVETSGVCPRDVLLRLASLGALFLYDLKGADPERHLKNTGVALSLVTENLDALTDAGADVILRLPIIPGYNDSENDLSLMRKLLSRYAGKVRRAEIMPFHRIGIGKMNSLGFDAGDLKYVPDGKSMVDGWREILSRSGVTVISN
ncbi:MAG: glycyl-radical enzyme activating protein [Clostridia bacterium]|nr:glycyl-radical enzyme activating protein [Clostridia bacterium]